MSAKTKNILILIIGGISIAILMLVEHTQASVISTTVGSIMAILTIAKV